MSRNGRSSSQISIDNYPEHLNPFYEDDNHKRLRFWNLKKKGSDKGRRSSFSIENLRDIWTFKSFSLKKKSSTLGINKTSESPPVLRRQLNEPCDYNNFLNTRDRYSEAGTSPMRNELNLSYRRPYRSSLQNIDAKSENGSLGNAFNRNDMYRATTQSVGYLTPNFRRNHHTRSSQSSLSSTNPFESDVETNVDSISTTSRKSYRKKKRAPLPPPRATINNDITTETITTENTNGNLDIKSLTSEIEHFVNITNESLDNPDPPAKVERVTTRTQPNNLIKSNVQLSSFAPEKDASKNSNGEDTKIVQVENASASPQITLCIDENRNFYKNQTSKAEVTAPARRGRPSAVQKIETISPISLPATDRLQIDEQTSHVDKFENSSDTITEHPTSNSKIVSETVTSKAQSVLNTKDEAQDYTLKNTKESLTKQTIKDDTTEKPKISDEIVVVKTETDVKPKVIKTYEFPSDQPRDDSNTMTQKVVIKASLSKTENTNNVLQNFASANGSANGTTTRMSTDQAIEEKAPIKSILQNKKPSNNNNILFIEEQHISTSSITKHTDLPSEVVIQDPIIVSNGSSLPKSPQNEIVLTSSPKIGLTAQENKFKFNVGNAQTFASPSNQRFHHQNDEPTLSTSSGTENNDALNQPGKKRSVREVIESINRSQRMLNESIAKGTKIYSTPLFVEHKNTHSNELNSFNTKSTQMMETKNISVTTVSSNEGSAVEPQPNVFHKSKINKMVCDYRESSPTASNLDWNPLPKPKRTNNNC
ncbi:uncharacterized protein Dwil_GK15264 [Drosophila willistoni]|uniref:Uncharacterized protein n=1 Tax=Drosophila willistoni TaxID=7260 RepID=B4MUD4_DROWI|nr:uncharacterized protein YMR317W [Drosophila willistoni]EDW76060.2 uncharacterized protein Dwil_GK15264 [Drosophila willistoni]